MERSYLSVNQKIVLMNCPNCDRELVMTDRNGVEIDYCPGCRGVWLDRGELDKIIERSNQFTQGNSPQGNPQRNYGDDKRYSDDKREGHSYPHKKKKGFLGNLFDF